MALFHKDGSVEDIGATARNVFDVTGAGDTVISALAVATAAGLPMRTAAIISNLAAGIVIESVGTAAVDGTALAAALKEHDVMEQFAT